MAKLEIYYHKNEMARSYNEFTKPFYHSIGSVALFISSILGSDEALIRRNILNKNIRSNLVFLFLILLSDALFWSRIWQKLRLFNYKFTVKWDSQFKNIQNELVLAFSRNLQSNFKLSL